MAILVTGGSGFIGHTLIEKLLARGQKVYSLSRHPPAEAKNLIPLTGDITLPNLGLVDVPKDIDEVIHLAGIHSLRLVDTDNAIHDTNIVGTKNVLDTMVKHTIQKLVFTSTAYTWDINPYGRSKIQNEKDIAEYAEKYNLSAVVLRPSVVMGEPSVPYEGHFVKFVKTVVKLHHYPERVRKAIERTLRLPLLQPVFRIPGLPSAHLNLIRIDDVIQALLNFNSPGVYWIVNDKPPELRLIALWVGEVIDIDMKFIPEKFTPSVVEAIFQRKAKPFLPYLWGDDFTPKASIKAQPTNRAFIEQTVRSAFKVD